MNRDTYGGWLVAWAVAFLPMGALGWFAMQYQFKDAHLGIIGIILSMKFCVLMMLLGRFFSKRFEQQQEGER